MKKLFQKFIQLFAPTKATMSRYPLPPLRDIPTGNPGTASKPDDEVVKLLRSIDKRLATLESCVKENHRDYGVRKFIATGHWNQ
jgi:hypothetical protein